MKRFIPKFLVSWYHFVLAFLGALLYGFPSRNLVVIGVTGTSGKSTTVDMISRVFQEAGHKTASVSSIRFQIGKEEWRNKLKMTMPGRFTLQKFLKRAVQEGCTHIVLEVTSEGMAQHRHRFISFHTAVFTNLSPEHIERHGSFENYKKAKAQLFVAAKKLHVLNADDEHTAFYASFPAEKTLLYSTEKQVDVRAESIQQNPQGISFSAQKISIALQLQGLFNVSNALAAITTAQGHGISTKVCKKALEQLLVVPGRMEQIVAKPFSVVVDYALTPVALEKVYQSLKPATGKLICVVSGTGGGRDKWKRPVMGKVAATYCARVIVTNEDPYEEDPLKIIEQVASGAGARAEIIEDRRKAIRQALREAKTGDVVVITGKGSEDSMALAGGKKIPWDDRQIVREELEKLKG